MWIEGEEEGEYKWIDKFYLVDVWCDAWHWLIMDDIVELQVTEVEGIEFVWLIIVRRGFTNVDEEYLWSMLF